MNYFEQVVKINRKINVTWSFFCIALLSDFLIRTTISNINVISTMTVLIAFVTIVINMIAMYKVSKIVNHMCGEYDKIIFEELNIKRFTRFQKEAFLIGRNLTARKRLKRVYKYCRNVSNQDYINFLIKQYNNEILKDISINEMKSENFKVTSFSILVAKVFNF